MWIQVGIAAFAAFVFVALKSRPLRETLKNSVPLTVFYWWGRGRRLYYYVMWKLGLLEKWSADEVLPGVFLGSARDATNFEELKRRKITRILSIASGFLPTFPGDFEYLYIDQLDVTSAPIKHHFPSAAKFMSNGDRVLVHCMQGISRSSTLIAAHLIEDRNMSASEAIAFLQGKRAKVNPNSAFRRELVEWETSTKRH